MMENTRAFDDVKLLIKHSLIMISIRMIRVGKQYCLVETFSFLQLTLFVCCNGLL